MTAEQLNQDRVALLLQTALLGEVPPALRRVGFDLGDCSVTLHFFFDGPIAEDDRESASVVETEMVAMLSDDVRVTLKVERVDTPERLPTPQRLVYSRRE
ncbi:hypothetical protein MASR1M101_38420 [Gemmatimonas sp.]